MSNRVILSIDDSKAVHAFIDRCLSGSSYSIQHAMGAREGINLLLQDRGKFGLVLMDWEMPEMTGPEAVEEIRKHGIQVPIIMLTSKNDPSDIAAMLERGVQEYVMKPFTPEIILEKISSVIGTGD